ncbi:ATP-binding protein [Streptomyces griseoruber]|uniref:Uncharacterized protein n=1 Tax=Streptomyces griseoruber TaxID=1943 RepID=A0A101SQ65_9ACTN|nr:tetratricopeptide repeat protein [Streptomyces griseoruber]KUN78006.1 hypothetical protein AQJ64_32945 [Streptomyces griseoruber]
MRVPPSDRLEAMRSAVFASHARPESSAWQDLATVVRTAARTDGAVARLWPPENSPPATARPRLERLVQALDELAAHDGGTERAVTWWLRRHAPGAPPGTSNTVGGNSVIHGPSVQGRDFYGDLHFHGPPEPARARLPVPRQLPPATARFVDRESDRAALDALRAGHPAHHPQVLVVSGLAGVGKTTLVSHWLHEHSAGFPDGILYSDLGGHRAEGDGGPVPPATVLERFLLALGAPVVPADTAGRSALWRSLTAGLRLAVVLDNAVTAAQVRPLLPGTSTALTVVTSRTILTGLRVDGAALHRLEALPAESAVALLAVGGGSRVAREPAAAQRVVELCGRLPLTVCLASAQLAVRPHRSVSALAETLSRTQGALDGLHIEGEAVMRTALDLSYGLLPRESATLYRRMGLLPTDRHDLALLTALTDASDLTDVDNALHALVEANLVEETGPGVYRFHDLVRQHAHRLGAEREGPEQRDRALRGFVDWCLATAAVAESLLTPSHPLPDHAPPAPHAAPTPLAGPEEALAWLDTHRDGLMNAVRHCAEAGWHTSCWRLTDALWPLFQRLRPSDMWIEAHRLGLDAARRSGSQPGEGRMLTSGAIGLRDGGRYEEAADWYRQALELALAEGDVRQQAQAVNGLGHLCLLTGRLDEAREHFGRALRLRESIGYHRGAALSRRRLGETALAAGDLPEAARQLSRALTELESLQESYEATRALALLGRAETRGGNEDGTRHLREALERFRTGPGRSEHWEARTLEWLGRAAETRGETAQAVGHYEAARDLLLRLDPAGARRLDDRLRHL